MIKVFVMRSIIIGYATVEGLINNHREFLLQHFYIFIIFHVHNNSVCDYGIFDKKGFMISRFYVLICLFEMVVCEHGRKRGTKIVVAYFSFLTFRLTIENMICKVELVLKIKLKSIKLQLLTKVGIS